MKTKKLLAALLLMLCLVPAANAVFKEKNLQNTLSALRYELRRIYTSTDKRDENLTHDNERQHVNLVSMMQASNELSLMLYSQQQDFTFDLTYALEKVSAQYKAFASNRMPFDEISSMLDTEIERYSLLISTLEDLPAVEADAMEELMEAVPDSVRVAVENAAPPAEEPKEEETIWDALKQPAGSEETALPDSLAEVGAVMSRAFELDTRSSQDRDSCLFYARAILSMYKQQLAQVKADSAHYEQTSRYLQETYDYALKRYRAVQKSIFTESQGTYFATLGSLGDSWDDAVQACEDKYSNKRFGPMKSEWRGQMIFGFLFLMLIYVVVATLLSNLLVRVIMKKIPILQISAFKDHTLGLVMLAGSVIFALTAMILNGGMNQDFFVMASGLLVEFAWLLAAIFASLCIRLDNSEFRRAILVYSPVIILSLLIICFRIIFIPNALINIIFPPILLAFALWQVFAVRKSAVSGLPGTDRFYSGVSLVVMVVVTVMAWLGFELFGLLVVVWWMFQLTMLQAITAIRKLVEVYNTGMLKKKLAEYGESHAYLDRKNKGAFVEITWLYDLFDMCVMPLLTIVSIPACIIMAGNVFDLSEVCWEFFFKPLVTIDEYITFSLLKVFVVVGGFFLFRYLNYVSKGLYRAYRTKHEIQKNKQEVLRANQINFTLANNLFAVCWWGAYIIACFVYLHIPATAITVVCTGLATGIGLALKDVLNNFFYGMQLMSGRLRVGDIIECDGVRGTVDSITYQSTQILADEGCIMAFTNSTLFSKNFKNLTRNHSYLLLKVYLSVSYGTSIDQVRELVLHALEPLRTKDQYGREVVDPAFGLQLRLMEMADSGVELAVYQYVTVEAYYSYAAKAREIIYNTLNENDIEIPFPQLDIHMRTPVELEGKGKN